jgi:hypothetical protein
MSINGDVHPVESANEEGAIREYVDQPVCPTQSGVLGVGVLSALSIVILSVCIADSIHKVRKQYI